MKRYTLMLAGLVFLLGWAGIWGMAAGEEDTVVGLSGDLAKLQIDGVTRERANAIRIGLLRCADLLPLRALSVPAKPFRLAVQKAIVEGYLSDGYPDVKVRLVEDKSGLHVAVDEGKRFISGAVELEIPEAQAGRSVDTQTIIGALKSQTAGGFMDVRLDGTKTQIVLSSNHVNGGFLWETGTPAGFNEAYVQKLKEGVWRGLARQGYFWPDIDVQLKRDGDKVVLHATVKRLGQRAKVQSIGVNGLKSITASQVGDFLKLHTGDTVTLEDLTGCVQKLFESGCFIKQALTLDAAHEGVLDVRIDVQEVAGPRELGAPWTPAEQALLNFCRFVQHLDQEKDDLVWEFAVPEGGVSTRVITNAGQGWYAAVQLDRPKPRIAGRLEVLLTRTAFSVDSSWTGRRFYAASETPLPMKIQVCLDYDKASFGGGLIETKDDTAPPLQYEIYVAPAAILKWAHDARYKVDLRDGMLRVEMEKTTVSVDAKSGRVQEIVGYDKDRKVVGRAYLKAGALAEAQRKMKDLPEKNVYDAAHPAASVIAYVCETLTSLGTQSANEQDKKTVAQLAGIFKLFSPELVSRLDDAIKTLQVEKDPFEVPPDRSRMKGMQSWQLVAYAWLPQVVHAYSYGSWPETLLREGALTLVGQDAHGLNEVQRVYRDEKMGPLGYLLYSEALHFASGEQEAAFAARGIERLDAAAFENDLRALLEGDATGPAVARQFLRNLAQLTPEELAADTERFPAEVRDAASAVYQQLKAAGSDGLEDWPKLARGLWPKLKPPIEAALRRHLPPTAVCDEKAAAAGDAGAMDRLGLRYQNGDGVVRDPEQARAWYHKSAEAGNTQGMLHLARFYLDGKPSPTDEQEANEWLTKSAGAGNVDAMKMVASTYSRGAGVTQDYKEAMKWYVKAQDAGDAESMWRIGTLYRLGLGVDKDRGKAHEWYERAAAKGYRYAQKDLDEMNQQDAHH